jgi:hypothetical protein
MLFFTMHVWSCFGLLYKLWNKLKCYTQLFTLHTHLMPWTCMHQKVFVFRCLLWREWWHNGAIKDWCEAIKMKSNSKCKGCTTLGCKQDNMNHTRLLLGLLLENIFLNILQEVFKIFKIYVIFKSFEIYL